MFLRSPYVNLRKWILDESNPVTYTDMLKAVMGGSTSDTTRQMKQIVAGAEHCYVTIHQIRKMLALTGMTFEELFYREPQKKEDDKPGDNV